MKTKLMLVLAVVIVAIQFVPVSRNNPPVTSEVRGDAAATAILKRACYDCHSNETVWPWYAYVAPVSWLVADDVNEAREHMNFSTWDVYSAKQQAEHLEEIVEKVAEGDMPLWYYVPLHSETKVSPAELDTLRKWQRRVAATLPAGALETGELEHEHGHADDDDD